MISTSDLQALLEKIDGGSKGVDLVKVGLEHCNAIPRSPRRLRVALDIESCLDRFYGGYYSDWACGGQFNRCFQFVQLLVQAFQAAQMDVIIFFDGTLKENKKLQMERNDYRQRTISVLKHIRMIGTPPPKIWWLPPSGLRTCLRNALRTFNIPVVQTIHDHTMEVIDYFHEHKLNGVIGLHPDFIIFNVSRYFSSHDIRLSYKGALETKEFMVTSILNHLKMIPEKLAVVAVLLGGYILIDEPTLKKIYQKMNIEYNQDFEARLKQLADALRPIPLGSTAEAIIKHLNLSEFSDALKESIEYYQRKGIFGGKRYLGSKKKPITEIIKNIDIIQDSLPIVPMASETSEHDEIANKILKDVNNLVNDEPIPSTSSDTPRVKCIKFIYSLPAEVLRTSYQRHQRGHMDPRIYILLTKKEILMPQVLEDEQYREMPSIHLFYRPARQMIYAVLFNLYHQKYMCSKTKDNLPSPDVIISEWTWSPQNEYKKADEVYAKQLPWAVPTIQRLWFGTTFDDKHRRMRAFLTVMRSDTTAMLNRSYVPQHLLVLACVLRYILSNPDRSILTRQELDAFIVTAFSPQLVNVDYTQEMVLPGVYLRGVFLASLFMQGVETAQLANDACGVPLPWNLTNPWLFFDGKLFHLKLRMAMSFQNLRELCDDQMDLVLRVDRFRKAILEDLDTSATFQEQIVTQRVYQAGPYAANTPYGAQSNPKQMPYSLIHHGTNYPPMPQQMFYAPPNMMGGHYNQQQQQQQHRQMNNAVKNNQMQLQKSPRGPMNYQKSGYQLKVGGVVVGSWAQNRSQMNARANRTGMLRFPINQRAQRGANKSYRTTGGMMTNRFVNATKQKKTGKSKKDNNNSMNKNTKDETNGGSDESEEEDGDKKVTILKGNEEEKKAENGNQSVEETHDVNEDEKDEKKKQPEPLDDNRNGTDDADFCDKKSSDDLTSTNTAITDVLSSNDDDVATSQVQSNNSKNGKSGKNKKKGKADQQVSTTDAAALKA